MSLRLIFCIIVFISNIVLWYYHYSERWRKDARRTVWCSGQWISLV